MKIMTRTEKPNRQIMEQAAVWAEDVDHGNLSPEQREALADWLLKSPDHVNEFLIATSIFEAWGEIDESRSISIEELLAQKAPEVIPLLGKAFQEKAGQYPVSRRKIFAVAASFALVCLATYLLVKPEDSQIYATTTGEQRSLPLEDGSIIHMNTATEIQVSYSDHHRNITLLKGEALFQVAHDPARPFAVHAGHATAVALGTIFNVYRQGDQTTVSVVEGKVAVGENDRADAPRTVSSGERATVQNGGGIKTAAIANIEAVTSWRLRKLVFERETLATIVEEYNRYNKVKIRVDDREIAEIRFSGIFSTDDPESLIKFLEQTAGIVADRNAAREIHLLQLIN